MNPVLFAAALALLAGLSAAGGFLAGFVVGMEETKKRLKGKNCL